jgi:hypothetical protein
MRAAYFGYLTTVVAFVSCWKRQRQGEQGVLAGGNISW